MALTRVRMRIGTMTSTCGWMNKVSGIFALQAFLLLPACERQIDPVVLAGQQSLPVTWQVFDLMAKDLDGDGLQEIVTIDHGAGAGQVLRQQKARQFELGPVYKDVGFHPGEMIEWQPGQPTLVLGAEGSNSVQGLKPEDNEGFSKLSSYQISAPRHIRRFEWPEWGASLAISPFANGVVNLLLGYDPANGSVQKRLDVSLSETQPTIRAAERITPVDIDGDGVAELLFVVAITNEVIAIKKPENENVPPEVKVLARQPGWGMPNEVHAIDLDGDGDFDLLIPDESAPSQINVLLNDGSGHFKSVEPIPFAGEKGIMELRIGRERDGQVILFAAGPGAVALYRMPRVWDGKTVLQLQDIARHIVWKNDVAFDMDITDLDGDGWLDGVLGRVNGIQNVWVVYGPLWERFDKLSKEGFEVKNEVAKSEDEQ